MAQTLTVVRIGTNWAVRDVTGATDGLSSDIGETMAAARRLARRVGTGVQLTPEAERAVRKGATPSAG